MLWITIQRQDHDCPELTEYVTSPPNPRVDCSQNGPEMVLISYCVVYKWSGNRLEIDLMRRLNCSSYVGNRLWSLSPGCAIEEILVFPVLVC